MSTITHEGLSKEQTLSIAGGRVGVERDLGAVDPDAPMPSPRGLAQGPVTINVGYLPSQQPMCPCCLTGLHAVRQNERGDSLFECLQPCAGDGYMAVYRVGPPASWEQFGGRGVVDGWKPPVRFGDVARLKAAAAKAALEGKAAPAELAEQPAGGWPGDSPTHVAAPVATSEDAMAALGFDAPPAPIAAEDVTGDPEDGVSRSAEGGTDGGKARKPRGRK
jgi:hypothetical protein